MGGAWYERAFAGRYLELYAHRNEEEAARAVALLAARVPLAGSRVLDIACGAGRHLAALREAGARPTGIDLSTPLLRRAVAVAPAARADMRRLPILPRSQEGAVCMFTSFGYFPTAEENVRVLHEAAGVLRGGGWFLLDTLNPEETLRRLEPEGERRVGRAVVREKRLYLPDTRSLVKKVIWTDPVGGEEESWEERLRLFFPAELEEELERAGFRVEERIGEYDGSAWRRSSSRCILFSRRSGP
ncbi:MAG: class I SAM-dependent methyltransferase [Candidatus Eisenbacteria bacterium]|nr:class I SAM-dependent methyltransferase [Candidatus Eisenbacteria bacterium]